VVGEVGVGGVAETVKEAGGLKFALRKAVDLLERAKGDLKVLGEGGEAKKLTSMTDRLQVYLKTASDD
jgi:hypothetical protein